jgi:tRNA G18 (ribose-2'-O)-methylase SpoU
VMPTLESLFVKKSVLLVLEDLANHDNMGGLFRSLAALAGPDRAGVVLSTRCCDPLYRKALRVSMGCALRVEWAVAAQWPAALEQIAAAGFEVLAMTPGKGAQSLGELEVVRGGSEKRIALVLGAEGPGLSKGALDACARRVKIPIDPSVDSLNVGVAGAIALAFLCQSGGRDGT